MTAPPAVLVMSSAGVRRPELAEHLGPRRLAELELLLARRAVRWAEEVTGGGRVHAGADDAPLARALERVFAEETGRGPVLVTWPVLPCWRAEHADAVLDDLSAGCQAVVGPVFDGGLYMLALAGAVPSLFALPARTWEGPGAMGRALEAINEAGLDVGLLRAERGLRRMADLRAALADPLLDAELRALLSVGSAAD